jgi:methylthioribulose-1-phosphate dehydratase
MTYTGTGYKALHHQKNDNRRDLTGSSFLQVVTELAEAAKNFYSRGWVLGTSGNFSTVISVNPLRLAITTTRLDKGCLTAAHFVEIDGQANVMRGEGRPSSEALLHLAIVRCGDASVVLHTHSVWSTVLSGTYALFGGVKLEGYEMLKGLKGVRTHKHREWLPILENSQNIIKLSEEISTLLRENPRIHGFLLQDHGFYTWGDNLHEAKHNIEILEFLMEVMVRSAAKRYETHWSRQKEKN